jgi:hypothetical protein
MTELQALALTLACEVPLMLLLARKLPVLRVLPVAATASMLTHPIAWHVASILSPDEYRAGTAWIEGGVVLAEALWYRLWLSGNFLQSLAWSFAANAFSFMVGWLVFTL